MATISTHGLSPTPAAPPTPQEVSRKLSLHAAAARAPRTPAAESEDEGAPPGSPFAGLHPIAERARAESGEDDSEDEDDGERGPAPRVDAGDAVVKSGYLWKKGERRKSWKKRWFVLRTGHIAYYKTSAEYRLLRMLDLADVHTCVAVPLKRHAHTFALIAPARTFYLEAASAGEMAAWIGAVAELRAPPAPTSGGSAPVPIPVARTPSGPPPVLASSPGYGVTTSDSDDAVSIASVQPAGRARSTSRSGIGGSGISGGSSGISGRSGAGGSTGISGGGSAGVAFAPAPPTPRVPAADWDPRKEVLSGYLMKCGSKRRHWRKRWFMLTGEKLAYSGSHMDTKAHREIPLAQILDTLEADASTEGEHTFKIVTTKRTLLLCAPGEDDEIRWLSAVRALLARRDGGSGGGGGTSTRRLSDAAQRRAPV